MAHDSFEYEMPAPAEVVFDWQTHRRFSRMRAFLETHAGEVAAWRQEQAR